MADNIFNEERVSEARKRIEDAMRKQLEDPVFQMTVSYGKPVGELLAPLSYSEQTAELLKQIVAGYIEELKSLKTIKGFDPVNVGSFTSSAIFKDKGRYPKHRATAHFSNGVAPRNASYQGKWRRAKRILRAWIDNQRGCLALDASVELIQPAEYIEIQHVIEKPLAEDM